MEKVKDVLYIKIPQIGFEPTTLCLGNNASNYFALVITGYSFKSILCFLYTFRIRFLSRNAGAILVKNDTIISVVVFIIF